MATITPNSLEKFVLPAAVPCRYHLPASPSDHESFTFFNVLVMVPDKLCSSELSSSLFLPSFGAGDGSRERRRRWRGDGENGGHHAPVDKLMSGKLTSPGTKPVSLDDHIVGLMGGIVGTVALGNLRVHD
ncbi:hypothetical protein ABZP36_019277 [Zizania latifolia]